jgi:hypothetical protein
MRTLNPAFKPLTSDQIRAARALLRWRAEDLARASSVGVATIHSEGRAVYSDGLLDRPQ